MVIFVLFTSSLLSLGLLIDLKLKKIRLTSIFWFCTTKNNNNINIHTDFQKIIFTYWYHFLLNSGLLIIFANIEILNLVGWKLDCLFWTQTLQELRLFVFQIHLLLESSCSIGTWLQENVFKKMFSLIFINFVVSMFIMLYVTICFLFLYFSFVNQFGSPYHIFFGCAIF